MLQLEGYWSWAQFCLVYTPSRVFFMRFPIHFLLRASKAFRHSSVTEVTLKKRNRANGETESRSLLTRARY